MPRVASSKLADHEIYGKTKVDPNLSFGERIRKYFRPGDTVQVRNITDQELEWQWLDEQDETYTIEDDTNIKITDREDPGVWRLGGGEIDVLPGACAYLMIEAQYKMVCVMKTGITLHPLSEREIRNFSIDDPERQEQFIKAVFIGKLTPTMMHEAAISSFDGDQKESILERLMPLDTEETEERRRQISERQMVHRPRTVVAPHTELSDLAAEFDENAPAASSPGPVIPTEEDENFEPLGGRATGGLPDDRKAPVKEPAADVDQKPKDPPKKEEPEQSKKTEPKKEPAADKK